MKNVEAGVIVLVPFPFTDLSSVKMRPALVISNDQLEGSDVILCGITSRKSGQKEVLLTDKDLVSGGLPLASYVRFSKVVSLQQNIIQRVVAKVSRKKLTELVNRLEEVLG